MARCLYSQSINELGNRLLIRRSWFRDLSVQWWQWQQDRQMATSRRVQDRSKLKRVHDLEIVLEKHKISSKILFLLETLKVEPEQVISVRDLDQYRRQINLPKPHKISDFLRKSPKLFELYKDQRGILWCGLTEVADKLLQEEDEILEAHADKAAEYITRLLMMSIKRSLPLDKIAHFRRDMGLQRDFRTKWVHKYPHHFKVVKDEDDIEHLELVSWNPAWAVTELEKKVLGEREVIGDERPSMLSLPFPMKFPPDYKKVYRYGGKIENFQKRLYLSPYGDATGLKAGSQEFDKRAIAIIHEVLSFTIEKRLVTDHLTHFRWEFVMPQKLMRIILKQFGIFYVSERGKRFSVFLTEAYNGSELIEKNPFVIWREKVQRLIGYRGKKKPIETFSDLSDKEDYNLYESESGENLKTELEADDIMDGVEDASRSDGNEMDVGDIIGAYSDIENLKDSPRVEDQRSHTAGAQCWNSTVREVECKIGSTQTRPCHIFKRGCFLLCALIMEF